MSRASAPIDEIRRLELIPTELFAQLDIPEDQIHLPDGTVLREEVFAHCAGYEAG